MRAIHTEMSSILLIVKKKASSADMKNCALFQIVHITAVTEAHHTYERRHTGSKIHLLLVDVTEVVASNLNQ